MRLAARVTVVIAASYVLVGCAIQSPATTQTADTGAPVQTDTPSGSSSSDAATWAAEVYPVFETVTITGDGNELVPLPHDALTGVIHARHDDLVYVGITILDEDMNSTGDLLVNHPGVYDGTTVYGLRSYAGVPTYVEVRASGAWSITISPVSSLPVGVTSGVGDVVFLYEGPAMTAQFTHDGDANFVVTEHSPEIFNWLRVNELGVADVSTELAAGPTMIAVKADGAWTMSAS